MTMTKVISETANASETPRTQRVRELRKTLIDEAHAIGPFLSEHTDVGDRDLRLAEAVTEKLIDSQLFRLWQPRRYDGHEVDVATQIEVTAVLATYCASAAWVTALYGACCYFASLYSGEAQAEVFGTDKDARVCGVLAPMAKIREVDGGIRVDGRWPYASGSETATWATVGAPRPGGAEGTALLLLPMRELTVDYTWDMIGMRGTSSNTLVCTDLFVPHHRILPFFCTDGAIAGHVPTEYQDEALYRTPLAGLASACIVGPLIGMAKSALAHTLEHIVQRPVAYTFATDQSALVSTQLAVADAATKIDSAELHIYRGARDLDEAAESGSELSMVERARMRHDVGHGTRLLREAMNICQELNGSSDMATGSKFARVWRDFSTASLHLALSPATTSEVYGKALCGHDPRTFSGLV
ncbi:MAG: 3-hydroxy-9,10-secoandrosta-1,3,5(10)-triene-9,17-dione monooxygenase [Gammaproteobacteria bacterium]|jgi:3-hydroxy-9,10-secoandrosta-1,3,5(10)-triene-9,17-dione monooxygenase